MNVYSLCSRPAVMEPPWESAHYLSIAAPRMVATDACASYLEMLRRLVSDSGL